MSEPIQIPGISERPKCSFDNTPIDQLPPEVIRGIDHDIKSRNQLMEDRIWKVLTEEFGDMTVRSVVASLEYLKNDWIAASRGGY